MSQRLIIQIMLSAFVSFQIIVDKSQIIISLALEKREGEVICMKANRM